MVKWSRIELALSVITAAGLWQTLRERIALGFRANAKRQAKIAGSSIEGESRYDICGAVHVHSTYSDGAGTVEEIANAGVEAGVDFVLLTDHSSLDAISNNQAKWYADGKALIVVGTEITTDLGHILALGVPDSMPVEPAPADEIISRIATSGGFGIVALPCDLKDHWRDFDRFPAGFGIEVFNLSSIARTKINIPALLLILARYISRRKLAAFHYVASRPTREIKVWDKLCAKAYAAGETIPNCIGSIDAHGIMKVARRSYNIPTYKDVFRVLTTHVLLNQPLQRCSEDATSDIAAINNAIRTGSSYACYDVYGDPRGFDFTISDSRRRAGMGETILCARKPNLVAEVKTASAGSIIRLIGNGEVIASVRGSKLVRKITKPGVYRVEVFTYKRRLGPLCLGVHPWIFSNPIQVRAS